MLKIRLIEEDDLDALAEVYAFVYKVFNSGESWTKETAKDMLNYWLSKQPDLAFLAEYDGKIVGGFLSGVKPWWDGVHLFDGELFVHPDFQNMKIGKALLKRLLEEATLKYDAKIFDAFTFNGYEFPLSWYKKIGFHEINEWTMFSGDIKEVLKNLGD
jgi:GNAT superfamily N-acetyltransferase